MKINFVCYGNICRSPMAEFVMKNLVAKAGLSDKVSVESSGCHALEGSPVANGTRHELSLHNIACDERTSRQFVREDYQRCDLIVAMDKSNLRDLKRITGGDPDHKIFLMMEFVGENRDVDDPYVTDNYAVAYQDISRACSAIMRQLAQS